MKQVVVVRHVSAESAGENMGDFVREISDAGERNARSFARRLAERDLIPEHLICSDAVRAVQTAEVFAAETGYSGAIDPNPDLYDATEETWLEVLRDLDDRISRVMVVGHNPALEALVHTLIGKHHKMQAGAVAVVEIDTAQWRAIAKAEGARLHSFIKPSER